MSGPRLSGRTAVITGGAGDEFASYCVTKAGIRGLIQVMAVKLAQHNIRVSGVGPDPSCHHDSRLRSGAGRRAQVGSGARQVRD